MADSAETVNVKKTVETATAQVKASAEKAQAQAEKMQAAGAQAFREAADKSVAGLTELNAEGKKNLEAVVASAAAAQKGVEALSAQTAAFTKKSWEDGVPAPPSNSPAPSIPEAPELTARFTVTIGGDGPARRGRRAPRRDGPGGPPACRGLRLAPLSPRGRGGGPVFTDAGHRRLLLGVAGRR